jgi:hypothetical protein
MAGMAENVSVGGRHCWFTFVGMVTLRNGYGPATAVDSEIR